MERRPADALLTAHEMAAHAHASRFSLRTRWLPKDVPLAFIATPNSYTQAALTTYYLLHLPTPCLLHLLASLNCIWRLQMLLPSDNKTTTHRCATYAPTIRCHPALAAICNLPNIPVNPKPMSSSPSVRIICTITDTLQSLQHIQLKGESAHSIEEGDNTDLVEKLLCNQLQRRHRMHQ